MSRFNTGNPLGSGSPLDLDDNAKNFDEAINTEDPNWVDRFGRFRMPVMEQERQFLASQGERENEFDSAQDDREQRFNAFIASSGYQFAGDYAPGIEITEYNQVIRDENGEFWRVSGQVDLPYVTTGDGIPEDDALVPAGDAVLRQDLSDPDKGAAMVARAPISVDSIADLLALPPGQRKEGLRYLVKGYYAGSSVGGGEFYLSSGGDDVPDGVVTFEADGAKYCRLNTAQLSPWDAGFIEGEDFSEGWQALVIAASKRGSKIRSDRKLQIHISGSIHIENIEHLDIDLCGSTIRNNTIPADGIGLRVSNRYRYLSTGLVSSAMTGSQYIDVVDASGVAPGDFVVVSSNQNYNPQRAEFLVSNRFIIDRVEGDRIFLTEPVYNDFDISAYDVTVRFTRPIKSPRVKNVVFIGNTGGTTAFTVLGAHSGEMNRCAVSGTARAGIEFAESFDSGFISCIAAYVSGPDADLGYGIYLRSVKRGYIKQSFGHECRHAFESGGGSEDCDLSFNHAYKCTAAGVATHGNSRRATIHKNRTIDCYEGIRSRGEHATITDNEVRGGVNLIVVGEAGNPSRIGLAAVGLKMHGNRYYAGPATQIGLYVNTTMSGAEIRSEKFFGVFNGTIVLINGEKCIGDLIDIDMRAASSSSSTGRGIYISPVAQDAIDVTIRGLKQSGCYDGVGVIEAGLSMKSKVRIFDSEISGNSNRPFDISGSFDILLIGGTVMKDNVNANGRIPAASSIATLLQYGVSGNVIHAS